MTGTATNQTLLPMEKTLAHLPCEGLQDGGLFFFDKVSFNLLHFYDLGQ